MANNLNDEQLRDRLAKVNAHDTDRIKSLLDLFVRDGGAIQQSLNEYHVHLGLGDSARYREDFGLSGLDFYQGGAQTFLQMLSEHPSFHEERSLFAGNPIFGDSDDPFLYKLGRDVSELLVAGALAIGFIGLTDQRYIDALINVAFNADAISNLLRIILSGKPIPPIDFGPEHYWLHVPDKLMNLYKNPCVLSVLDALNDFAKAAASNKATSWSTGITGLQPNYGCAGNQVTILGSGFGQTQPSEVEVWFPTIDGRCTKAQIAPRQTAPFSPQWSDTKIVTIVPSNVGNGCVGFVQLASNLTPLSGPASTLAGEMQQCFGKVAFSAAQKISTIGNLGLVVPCPPCRKLPPRPSKTPNANYKVLYANFFHGGPPMVERFSISPVVREYSKITGDFRLYVEPDTELTLDWRVNNATSIRIRSVTPDGPFIDVTGPIPQSRNIGKFTGSKTSFAIYQLTAANACGTIERNIIVWLRKAPALKILGIEVIQAIQHFDLANPNLNNTVRLVANKRTMIRVYVDSGITGGFDNGSGPNSQPYVMGAVTVWPSGATQGFSATRINPGGGDFVAKPQKEIDRGTLTNTINFELPVTELNGIARIEARVWVTGHENEVGTGWYTYDLNTVVNFEPRRTQKLMRILVRDDDPGRMNAAPTAAEYTTTMQGATTRYPIAENGFIIVIPPGFEEITTALTTYGAAEDADLSQSHGWSLLIDHVDWIAGQFPNQYQGAIWTALVPFIPGPPVYAWGGMAPDGLRGHPRFVVESRYLAGFAHEMGHTFAPLAFGWTANEGEVIRVAIGHAPCPPSGDPKAPAHVDPRLPPRTDEIGMDVAQNMLIPKGRGELMSYCDLLTSWPSIAFWDMVFDELN